jgi:hypothetical protein
MLCGSERTDTSKEHSRSKDKHGKTPVEIDCKFTVRFCLDFDPEDAGNMFLRIVGISPTRKQFNS